MKKDSRSDKIFQIISNYTRELDLQHLNSGLAFLQLQKIAAESGISPNNVSMETKKLYTEGKLIRIGSRPVAYVSLAEFEALLRRPVSHRNFPTADAFIEYCLADKQPKNGPPAKTCMPSVKSNFESIIGCRESLADPVKQAKAAMLYPPFGLHTLLTGPTGVGKSMFARAMYDFSLKSGKIAPGKALVTLNCANYADNPQLLMSLLFGYVKGAFTGADRERKGLIDQANDGILFLDEIHRLSPEGQEKLFLLMDQGIYNRLGETDHERRANVLIIGATTEDPSKVMLHTFLRRMTAQISLPPLKKRTIQERLKLVVYFLWRESGNIGLRIRISSAVLCALCYYDCTANIGQLSSDIKLACANAYFDYVSAVIPVMEVQLRHLTEQVRNGLYITPTENNKILNSILADQQLVIDGSCPSENTLRMCIKKDTDMWF